MVGSSPIVSAGGVIVDVRTLAGVVKIDSAGRVGITLIFLGGRAVPMAWDAIHDPNILKYRDDMYVAILKSWTEWVTLHGRGS